MYIKLILITLLSLNSLAMVYNYDPSSDIIGKNKTIILEKNSTWKKLSLKYEISINDLKKANEQIKHKYRIPKATKIILPMQYVLPKKSIRKGIVINMAEQRLYLFSLEDKLVYTYPVAMGRNQWRTPTGQTAIKSKTMYPTWYVPESIRTYSLDKYGKLLPEFVPPGPSNPLGTRAIYLKIPGILIHGTNNKHSIGKLVSSGCIRMYNHNVEELYDLITPGTTVTIVHHPIKTGIKDNQVYLEVHESIDHKERVLNEFNHTNIDYSLQQINLLLINNTVLEQTLADKTGVTTIISKENYNVDFNLLNEITLEPSSSSQTDVKM